MQKAGSCLFAFPALLASGCWEEVCENIVPRNWRTPKGKTPYSMADGSSWALSTGTRGVNRTLWFCPIRAKSNGELPYGKEQHGDWGGAGISASVEGTAGQPAARGCSQLLARGGRTHNGSVFQNSEFWPKPAPSAGMLDTAQAGQSI